MCRGQLKRCTGRAEKTVIDERREKSIVRIQFPIRCQSKYNILKLAWTRKALTCFSTFAKPINEHLVEKRVVADAAIDDGDLGSPRSWIMPSSVSKSKWKPLTCKNNLIIIPTPCVLCTSSNWLVPSLWRKTLTIEAEWQSSARTANKLFSISTICLKRSSDAKNGCRLRQRS